MYEYGCATNAVSMGREAVPVVDAEPGPPAPPAPVIELLTEADMEPELTELSAEDAEEPIDFPAEDAEETIELLAEDAEAVMKTVEVGFCRAWRSGMRAFAAARPAANINLRYILKVSLCEETETKEREG